MSAFERRATFGGLQSDEYVLSMSSPSWEEFSAGFSSTKKKDGDTAPSVVRRKVLETLRELQPIGRGDLINTVLTRNPAFWYEDVLGAVNHLMFEDYIILSVNE